MDQLAIQQNRKALEYQVLRAIKEFETINRVLVDRVSLGRVEGVTGITSVDIGIKGRHNGT